MDKLDFLIQRVMLLEQRMTMLEGARGMDRQAVALTMSEMSKTIGMMMAHLLPIVNEREIRRKAIQDATIERAMNFIIKRQKYVM